ncbi:putative methyltransferase-domain-containing protein [Zopfochytrium polystomum]|nr:putative methyltransferase-domain-containing protein [Zopfochytrium polystomum]
MEKMAKEAALLDATRLVPYVYTFNDDRTELSISQDTTVAELGLTVWDASLILAKYIERSVGSLLPSQLAVVEGPSSLIKPKAYTILDIGAGTGILGIISAHIMHFYCSQQKLPEIAIGAVLTDQPTVVPLLAHNAKSMPYDANPEADAEAGLNSCKLAPPSFSVRSLLWGDMDAANSLVAESGPFDLILVSDCVYVEHLYEPLIATLAAVASTNSKVLLGYERRDFDKEARFFRLFGERFRFRHVEESEMDPKWKSPEDIYLFVGEKRSK